MTLAIKDKLQFEISIAFIWYLAYFKTLVKVIKPQTTIQKHRKMDFK